MKKILSFLFVLLTSLTFAQNSATTSINNNIVSQGIKGITATKLTSALNAIVSYVGSPAPKRLTVSQLRLLNTDYPVMVYVTDTDLIYTLDASDVSSSDDGDNIIVATAGGKRYKKALVGQIITSKEITPPSSISSVGIGLKSGYPIIFLKHNAATTDEKIWNISAFYNALSFSTSTDAGSSYNWMTIRRSASTVTGIELNSGNVLIGIGTASLQHPKFTVKGGALASSSAAGLGISSDLTTGRLGTFDASTVSSIHTNSINATTEISAGVVSGYITGISMTGDGATINQGKLRMFTTSQERLTINRIGDVGINNPSPSYTLDVNGISQATQYKLSALNTAPASASATGTLGEIRVTSTYIYVCTSTNTWVRSALATW